MKRDNPSLRPSGEVYCEDCPFTDDLGAVIDDLCMKYGVFCPTAATYQAACEFAEAHKEG